MQKGFQLPFFLLSLTSGNESSVVSKTDKILALWSAYMDEIILQLTVV